MFSRNEQMAEIIRNKLKDSYRTLRFFEEISNFFLFQSLQNIWVSQHSY